MNNENHTLAKAQARQNICGFEYRRVARSEGDEFVEVWRAKHPDHTDQAHDITITRFGISVMGDMGSLVFNVGASYGMKFLAGNDLGYIHDKLESRYKDVDIDEAALNRLLARGAMEYVDEHWPTLAAQAPKAVLAAWQILQREPVIGDHGPALEAFLEAFNCWDKMSQQFVAPMREILERVMSPDRGNADDILAYLDDTDSEFLTPVFGPDLLDSKITRPSLGLLTKLQMINQGARQILAQQQDEAAKATEQIGDVTRPQEVSAAAVRPRDR